MSRQSSTYILVMTTAIQAMVSMAAVTLPILASPIALSVGRSPTFVVGSVAAFVYCAAMVASLASGMLIQKWGAMRTSQIGLALGGLGLLLAGSGYLPALLAGAAFIGLGYGPITPASSQILARSTPPERMSLVFSVKQTGVPLGGFAAAVLAPALSVRLQWQPTVWLIALACAALAVFSNRLRSVLDGPSGGAPGAAVTSLLQPVQMVLRAPDLRRLAICSFVFAIAQLTVTAYTVTFLHEELGIALVTAGLLLSVAQVGGVVGRIGWGYLADRRLGPQFTLAMLAIGMAVCAACMPLLSASASMLVAGLLLLAFGICGIGWNGVYLAEVARCAPKGRAGAATGGTLAVTFLGNIVGPVLFAAIASHAGGYGAAYWALAALLAFAGIVLLRAARESRRTTPGGSGDGPGT